MKDEIRNPNDESTPRIRHSSFGFRSSFWFGHWSFFLIIILAFSTLIRLHSLNQPGLWMDELVSLQLSCGRGAVEDTLPRSDFQADRTDPAGLCVSDLADSTCDAAGHASAALFNRIACVAGCFRRGIYHRARSLGALVGDRGGHFFSRQFASCTAYPRRSGRRCFWHCQSSQIEFAHERYRTA